MLVALEYWTVN